MDKKLLIERLKNINGIVAVSQFGSFGTKYWIKDRSDIDLAIIVKPNVSYMDTLDIEDSILEIMENYYDYNNIHLTFIMYNDFGSKLARIAIDSYNVFVIDDCSWFDFFHYVLKYIRVNEKFERTLKIDEQYTYFGRLIDESLLQI